MNTIIGKVTAKPVQFAIAGAIVLGSLYFIGRRAVVDVASVPAGIVTGNNAITRSARTDAYQGAGILGTAGAVADRASGGFFSRLGERIGGALYDLTHKDYDPNEGLQTAPKTLTDGAAATDALWGRVGGVALRSN